MDYVAKIMSIEEDIPNTRRFIVPKPAGFKFSPGKGVLFAVNKQGQEENKKIGYFYSLNTDFYLEILFTEDITKEGNAQFFRAKSGEEIIISDIIGNLEYKNKGVFITSGKGIIPVLNIVKHLKQTDSLDGNTVLHLAKHPSEVMFERIMKHFLGNSFSVVIGTDQILKSELKRFDETILRQKVMTLEQDFYVAGPRKFVEDVRSVLNQLSITPQVEVVD